MAYTSEKEKGMNWNRHKIYIIAEIGGNFTTYEEAVKLIDAAKRSGVDAVKLQTYRAETLSSKKAVFDMENLHVTLLDTPGHVDFSAEMERTLRVLDAAVLVVSAADGMQGHTRTLWKLLRLYGIPVFLFVNKMDQEGTDKCKLLEELSRGLDEGCVSFDMQKDVLYEHLAMYDEEAMEEYLEIETLKKGTIGRLIAKRKVFPCYFGSALKLQGIQELLNGISDFAGFCIGDVTEDILENMS